MIKVSKKLAASIVLVVIAWPAGRYVKSRPWESPIKRAYRHCGECGLARDEIGNLIVGLSGTTVTRGHAIELYRATFDKPEDAELCLPCAEAVVDAALKNLHE